MANMRILRLPLLALAIWSSSWVAVESQLVTTSSFNFSSNQGSSTFEETLKELTKGDFKELTKGGFTSSDLKDLTDQINAQVSQQQQQQTQQKVGQAGQQDPLELINAMFSQSKEAQMAFVESFGETISQQTGLSCNIFGGEESCVQLSSDSEFARLCPDHDLKVDCIYSVEAAQEAQLNPMRDIKRALEAAKEQDIEADCPECFSNQLQWYCASLLPKCGTVRASVANDPLLSIIAEVVKVGKEGKDPWEALTDVLPAVVKGRSLTLPCKEMCLDMMDTCSCGQRKTMGQLLETYSATQTGESLPAAFSMQLFDGIKNTSFCDLFSPASAPGFAGTCQPLKKQCSDRQGWCEPGNPVPVVASEIMAGQLASSLFGVMNELDSGHSSAAVTTAAEVSSLEEKYRQEYATPSAASEKSSHTGLFIGLACFVPLAAIAGFGAAYWWTTVRKRRAEEEGTDIAMTENDRLLNSLDEP